jgi:hypothetical protein
MHGAALHGMAWRTKAAACAALHSTAHGCAAAVICADLNESVPSSIVQPGPIVVSGLNIIIGVRRFYSPYIMTAIFPIVSCRVQGGSEFSVTLNPAPFSELQHGTRRLISHMHATMLHAIA